MTPIEIVSMFLSVLAGLVVTFWLIMVMFLFRDAARLRDRVEKQQKEEDDGSSKKN